MIPKYDHLNLKGGGAISTLFKSAWLRIEFIHKLHIYASYKVDNNYVIIDICILVTSRFIEF